jgi:hypothetical protein
MRQFDFTKDGGFYFTLWQAHSEFTQSKSELNVNQLQETGRKRECPGQGSRQLTEVSGADQACPDKMGIDSIVDQNGHS